HMLEAAPGDIEFKNGSFSVAGTDRAVGIIDVARRAFQVDALPKDIEPGLYEQADYGTAPVWPNGTHICEVEIDEETGHVALVRYSAVDDMGVILNPLLAEGQVVGGIIQGVGQ